LVFNFSRCERENRILENRVLNVSLEQFFGRFNTQKSLQKNMQNRAVFIADFSCSLLMQNKGEKHLQEISNFKAYSLWGEGQQQYLNW